MNNESNNGMNNQSMSNQTYNGQSLNNQSMSNQTYNGQLVNNQSISNQTYNGQSLNNQSMSNQTYNGQPVNNQSISNQYQNYNVNSIPNQNPKNNKMLFLIIGVIVLIVIAVIVLIFVIGNNDSKGNTINDYENGGVIENDSNNNQVEGVTDEENSVSFQGFSIPKQIGYEYSIDTSGLLIGNDSFATMVSVTYGTLESIKASKDDLAAQYTALGYHTTNVKVANYGSREALTMEITVEGQKALFYAIDAGNNYSFFGLTMNPSFTVDYNDVKTSVSLLSNAKYTGVYRVNTDDVNVLEYKNLFE